MSLIEVVIRVLAKLGLLTGILLVLIGSFAVESNTAFTTKMVIVGICIALPDLLINFIEERMMDKK